MGGAKWACRALGVATGLSLQQWATGSEDAAAAAAAHCFAQESSSTAAAAAQAEAQLSALPDWLRAQGADVDAIEFKQSDTDAGRYGVYAGATALQRAARGWAGTVAGWAGFGRDAPIAVAAFPLSGALTAANLAGWPGPEGPLLQELLQLGVVDERGAVMLHLALERQRLRERGASATAAGAASPWVALLPQHFTTTPYWSELDLHWLRGTTLHKATRWAGACSWFMKLAVHGCPRALLLQALAGLSASPLDPPCLPAACPPGSARRVSATAGRGWRRRRRSWRGRRAWRGRLVWTTGCGPTRCSGETGRESCARARRATALLPCPLTLCSSTLPAALLQVSGHRLPLARPRGPRGHAGGHRAGCGEQ